VQKNPETVKLSNAVRMNKSQIKWSWVSRLLDSNHEYEISRAEEYNGIPVVGDLGLFRVARVGSHTRLINTDSKKLRIYEGDLFVGIFGNRYATDAFEAEVEGLKDLSLLTTAGMVGRIKSSHKSIHRSTEVSFLGFLNDKISNQKVNLKQAIFKTKLFEHYLSKPKGPENLLVIVGSGMNSGKTTVCRKLVKSFSLRGLSVAACKLTGSVSPRDFDEMVSASATYVTDFSDYGFPSTYKCEEKELLDLVEIMLEDTEKFNPDITIMEIADGVLQQETHFLLTEPSFQKKVKGLVVAADSAPSALYTVNHVENLGYKVIALSGAITSSPLYVKEFEKTSAIPVISSATDTIRFGSLFNNLIKKKENIHHSLVE
jgi:hypothetical protein